MVLESPFLPCALQRTFLSAIGANGLFHFALRRSFLITAQWLPLLVTQRSTQHNVIDQFLLKN
jgi:hypothetical protein